jgi:hypothetical protein
MGQDYVAPPDVLSARMVRVIKDLAEDFASAALICACAVFEMNSSSSFAALIRHAQDAEDFLELGTHW